MEKIVEKIGLYDTLCAVVGGVLAIMSIKLLDISFFRFIFANVPDSMHLVFLVFVGSLVGIVLQEIGSKLEHCEKRRFFSNFFRFRENGISQFLKWENKNDSDNSNDKNAVFDNNLEIIMARKKAYDLLPYKTGVLNKKFSFSLKQAQYVFQKMYKDVSLREGSSTIEMLNSLGSLSRSLCVWFFILALLYLADTFFRWKHNDSIMVPYPTTKFDCYMIFQFVIVFITLVCLSIIMYKRAERYQNIRLRNIVRLYAYYDDKKDESGEKKGEHIDKPINMKVEIVECKRSNSENE